MVEGEFGDIPTKQAAWTRPRPIQDNPVVGTSSVVTMGKFHIVDIIAGAIGCDGRCNVDGRAGL